MAEPVKKPRILIINGSLGGANGNTSRLLTAFSRHLKNATFEFKHLVEDPVVSSTELSQADGFLFSSGVYWDSWGSPLQIFFENATPLEGNACWFGKPAAALITMHSVGGKEVLSRLQGVLNTFGLYIPPMSAMTYSLANQAALTSQTSGHFESDLWCLDDLQVLATNLCLASKAPIQSKIDWAQWPVDRANSKRIWIQT